LTSQVGWFTRDYYVQQMGRSCQIWIKNQIQTTQPLKVFDFLQSEAWDSGKRQQVLDIALLPNVSTQKGYKRLLVPFLSLMLLHSWKYAVKLGFALPFVCHYNNVLFLLFPQHAIRWVFRKPPLFNKKVSA